MKSAQCVVAIVALAGLLGHAQAPQKAFAPGAKVFVAAMPDGFDTFLKSAIAKKKVPITLVESKDQADLEITGSSESQKAGAAKKIIKLSFHSAEQASISVADLKSGEVVFAYSVNKSDSAHGKQSTAEACAKHLKDAIEKK